MIILSKFGGIAPRYPAQVLKLPYAAAAQNCRVDDGTLTPIGAYSHGGFSDPIHSNIKTLAFYTDPSNAMRVFSFPQRFVSVEQHALPNDQYRRAYWCIPSAGGLNTGRGVFYGAYTQLFSGFGPFPGAGYLLGVPAPISQPILVRNAGTGNATPVEDGKTPFYRRFTYTVVSQFGEESGPYLPDTGSLEVITLYEGDTVTVSNMNTPSGNYALGSGSLKRVYMTDTSGNFRLVAEMPLAQTSITVNHMAAAGTIMTTAISAPAPQTMEGIKMAPQGFLVGWDGNTLHVSEALKYHSWPVSYQKIVPGKVQGVVPCPAGLILICDSGAYLAVGNDPANLSIVKISTDFGTLAVGSIVDLAGTAVFSSEKGIVACDGARCVLVSEPLILPRLWGMTPFSYGPKAVRHDGNYMFGNDYNTFVLAPKKEDSALVEIATTPTRQFNFMGYPTATHPRTGRAYVAYNGVVYEVESNPSGDSPYLWRSPVVLMQKPESGTCAKAVFALTPWASGNAYTTIKIWVDGVEVTPTNGVRITRYDLQNEEIYFRLPAYRVGRRWEFEFSGTMPLVSVSVANRFRDFRNE